MTSNHRTPNGLDFSTSQPFTRKPTGGKRQRSRFHTPRCAIRAGAPPAGSGPGTPRSTFFVHPTRNHRPCNQKEDGERRQGRRDPGAGRDSRRRELGEAFAAPRQAGPWRGRRTTDTAPCRRATALQGVHSGGRGRGGGRGPISCTKRESNPETAANGRERHSIGRIRQ
jgi:hypothetical protein